VTYYRDVQADKLIYERLSAAAEACVREAHACHPATETAKACGLARRR
jgi:hypothetical protein